MFFTGNTAPSAPLRQIARESVVWVHSDNAPDRSGFCVGAEHNFITAFPSKAHMPSGPNPIVWVIYPADRRHEKRKCRVIGVDEDFGLALLKPERPWRGGPVRLQIENPATPIATGTRVWLAGYDYPYIKLARSRLITPIANTQKYDDLRHRFTPVPYDRLMQMSLLRLQRALEWWQFNSASIPTELIGGPIITEYGVVVSILLTAGKEICGAPLPALRDLVTAPRWT